MVVGRGREHRLTRHRHRVTPIGRAVLVVRGGQEVLHRVEIGVVDARHLADFIDQHAADVDHGILVADRQRRVGKPFAAQLCQQRRLAAPLRTIQCDTQIILHARRVDPCHRRHQQSLGQPAVKLRILGAQRHCEQTRQPRHSVPFKAVEVVEYRMILRHVLHAAEGVVDALHRLDAVAPLEPSAHRRAVVVAELAVIVVAPCPEGCPRNLQPPREAVVTQLATQVGMIEQHLHDVVAHRIEVPFAVETSGVYVVPGGAGCIGYGGCIGCVSREGYVGEGVAAAFRRLPGEFAAHLGALRRHARHGLEARQPRHILNPAPRVLTAVQMQPHKVEGVDLPSLYRVGGMVGVEPCVLICHGAAMGGARGIGVPPVAVRGIDIRQERGYGLRDGEGAAEGPDDTLLPRRVLHAAPLVGSFAAGIGIAAPYLQRPRVLVAAAGELEKILLIVGTRPVLGVLPVVGIELQHPVWVEVVVGVVAVGHILRVYRPRREKHHPRRLEGGAVYARHTDGSGHHPRHGLVGLGVEVARQRHNHPHPLCLRTVLVGGMHKPADARKLLPERLHQRGVPAVVVEGHHRAQLHVGLLADAVAEDAGDIAADILHIGLPFPAHLQVLVEGFAGDTEREKPLPELFPAQSLTSPQR